MKRKLIRQGHNTTTITLPIEWIRRLNLKDHDDVEVIEQENSLIINAKEKREHKSITIDITDFTVSILWRYFQSVYKQGYDEIKIIFNPNKKNFPNVYHHHNSLFADTKVGKKFPPKPAIDMIQDIVNRFIGIEIIETGKNYCIIKDMTEPTAKEYQNSLRRVFMLTSGMFNRILTAIKDDEIGDMEICKEIHTMDINVDRFIDYCCRMLNKVNDAVPQNKKPSVFASLFMLELLSNEFKYMAFHIAKAKKKISNILPLAEKVQEHFKLYEKVFYNFDRDSTIKFGKNASLICDEHFKLKQKIIDENKDIARHFIQISKYLLSLIELRIEIEY